MYKLTFDTVNMYFQDDADVSDNACLCSKYLGSAAFSSNHEYYCDFILNDERREILLGICDVRDDFTASGWASGGE